jgi:hypothetical protein
MPPGPGQGKRRSGAVPAGLDGGLGLFDGLAIMSERETKSEPGASESAKQAARRERERRRVNLRRRKAQSRGRRAEEAEPEPER